MHIYLHTCKWCKEEFPSSRPHSKFCTDKCRLQSCRMNKIFTLLESYVPEEDIKKRYYYNVSSMIFELRWYREYESNGDYKRYADVWVSKLCKKHLTQKIINRRSNFNLRLLYTI